MANVSVLPVVGDVLFDARDGGRSLRISWHPVDDLCVLSIWRDGQCAATFQLARSETPTLINELVRGLVYTPPTPWSAANLSVIPSPGTGIARRIRARFSLNLPSRWPLVAGRLRRNPDGDL